MARLKKIESRNLTYNVFIVLIFNSFKVKNPAEYFRINNFSIKFILVKQHFFQPE